MFLITKAILLLTLAQPAVSGISSLGILIPPLAAACVFALLTVSGSGGF